MIAKTCRFNQFNCIGVGLLDFNLFYLQLQPAYKLPSLFPVNHIDAQLSE